MLTLYRELRRRKVFQTCFLYIFAAWGSLQIIDVLFPLLDLDGDEISRIIFVVTIAGFPIAFALAWFFQITPRGIVRSTPFVERRLLSNVPPLNDRRAAGRPGYFRRTEAGSDFEWTLSAETGPLAGLSFGVDRSLVLGRSLESDIAVVSPHVSRQHARLDLEAGQLMLEDLGSANGTVVNGRAMTGRCALQNEDEIRFHDIVFRVHRSYDNLPRGVGLDDTTTIETPGSRDNADSGR
ncbi:FHA domain-containing protein [Haliea sp. E1-2-M8]|uniref:FHA domain-containing protein n=1 Tax=Haliea sp. E1-2-M8 TaxID=3064706 RepID=UPI00271D7723|nr:FHA domain-containing protein [Haliea sp. E1-2-M8]MDO8862671.1 FHA domain-containing protein [Haliea sp. E1-2-M8]